ncbi:MAG: choice-of-anchor L domain-containing protein [Flavobacteriales bacterium]|nr:choice-of-anchor L domain-containing protein [Flavobacteriales bacterium]
MKRTYWILLSFLALLKPESGSSQLIIGEVDPYILVNNVLVGDGIKTSNIKLTGYKRAAGFFENGSNTALEMNAGIVLSTGIAMLAKGPNNVGDRTTSELGSGSAGSELLGPYAIGKVFDAAVLEFDFVPQTEEITFNYIFASEEYIEYVDKGVSDIFGFFISGPGIPDQQNVALVPGTNLTVSIDNVNYKRNPKYFRFNTPGEPTLQADGLTVTLTAKLNLMPCKTYTIKLAIADVGDDLLDSYVFIESGSFKHTTNIGKDTFICTEGFDIELDAGNPGRRVLWSTGETTQKIKVSTFGEYWVEVFTDCGSFKDHKKILPGVKDFTLGPDTTFCGDNFSKTLSVKNIKFENYLWSDASVADTLVVSKPGKYWLEVSKGNCKKSDTINVFTEPLPLVDLGKDTLICGPVDMIIGSAYTANKYLWNTGDSNFRIQVNSPGKYTVKVWGNYCENSDSIRITNRMPVKVDIGPPLIESCQSDTLRFRTHINDSLNYSINWSTGEKTPSILVSNAGQYKVLVRDKICNFVQRDSITVVNYDGLGKIWVPNAFSPDENGLNDAFKPVFDFANFNHYSFRVFDRWGQKLFETEDPMMAWNGKIDGQTVKNDAYMWTLYIKSKCSTSPDNFYRGVVHVIR